VAAARAALAHLQLPLPPAPAGSNMDHHLLPHFLHRSPPSPCFLLLRTQHKPKPPQPQLHLLLCTAFDSLAHSLQEVLDKHKPKLHLDTLFLHGNLPFAKVGVPPPPPPPAPLLSPPSVSAHHQHQPATPTETETEDTAANDSPPPRTLPVRLLNIPVDRLRSTLSTLSLTELIDLVPHLVARSLPSPDTHPDKKKLFSVHHFFRYAEFEGT
jgi:hypothetical protein